MDTASLENFTDLVLALGVLSRLMREMIDMMLSTMRRRTRPEVMNTRKVPAPMSRLLMTGRSRG